MRFKRFTILPSKGFLFFSSLYLINILFFLLFRLLFVIKFNSLFSNISLLEIFKAFLMGLKTDVNIVSYLITPFFLFGIVPLIVIKNDIIIRKIITYIYGFFTIVLFSFFIVNLEFFAEYNSHLNFTAIEYLNRADMIWFMVLAEYPIFKYLFLFLIVSGLYLFFLKKVINFRFYNHKSIIFDFIYFLIASALLFLTIRGSTGVSQINWGDVYFSRHNIINQTALNPIYNLYRDIYYTNINKQNKLEEKIAVYKDINRAIKYSQDLVLESGDSLIDSDYPLYKKNKIIGEEKRYNVVIILLEEFSAELVGAFGNKLGLTPRFDEIAKNGLLFTNFFSNGQRTNKGLSATMISFPPLVGKSLMVQTEGQQKIVSLASILKKRGYRTSFLYGGDIYYDNMKGFFVEKGVDKFVSIKDFAKNKILNKWGVADGAVFEELLNEFDGKKPFFSLVLSLTNHPPYTVPHRDYGQVTTGSDLDANYNTFKYVDYELGKFFDEAKKKDGFKTTLFIILGDHSKTFHHDLPFDYRKSYVPALFYAPHLIKPFVNNKISSQMDIAPTILDLLNISEYNSFWGRSMIKEKSPTDYALIVRNLKYGLIQNGFYLTGDFGGDANLYKMWEFPPVDYQKEFPDLLSELKQKVYLIEQTAFHLYKMRKISK